MKLFGFTWTIDTSLATAIISKFSRAQTRLMRGWWVLRHARPWAGFMHTHGAEIEVNEGPAPIAGLISWIIVLFLRIAFG
jgi:hypothetical protein